jgi:hypothetical protein
MNPLSYTSYILLDEEGVQYHQKIQIESAKVHGSLSKGKGEYYIYAGAQRSTRMASLNRLLIV